MADVMLNNYSDDSKIKQYIRNELMRKVFHDIKLNDLNTGAFSIINEYISQATEQMAFTSSFYYNEGFITKAVLPDSIYAEAAIFNIGYAFANPSATQVLLELKLDDLFNITQNAENKNEKSGLYEFILDKNTTINMKDGQTYSLDYDISLQYMSDKTAKDTRNGSWIVQYLNDEPNSISINKEKYISYRVTDNWLCLFLNMSEYTRKTHTVINNMANGVPNPDTLITCNDHICGFDIVYVEPATKIGESETRIPLRKDHIMPIHGTISDTLPYVHYIMDSSQTIRLMWQLQGNKYFVPKLNSRYEITVYTCHGQSANFGDVPDEQPNVVTATNRYKNNVNVMKAAFIISSSIGGTDIGTAEDVRRETIEAYNTVNVLSTDHDIEEWFKTFYFKHILFPFFFKRRDDPWGRIWSGFLALTNSSDEVYRTNTLHGFITYDQLYNNNQNTVTNNEIIIPPGWAWVYKSSDNLYTIVPYSEGDSTVIETARTLKPSSENPFVFTNPFGIRIQKSPFAIGYFNPWIDESFTVSRVPKEVTYIEDSAQVYHATPLTVNIKRTYLDDYYHMSFWLDVSQNATVDGDRWITNMGTNGVVPTFDTSIWTYFRKPTDLYAEKIPMLTLRETDQALPFNPNRTYLCVKEKFQRDDGYWELSGVSIIDNTTIGRTLNVPISITNSDGLIGEDKIWGLSGTAEPVYVSAHNEITCYGLNEEDDVVTFERSGSNDYYSIKIQSNLHINDGTSGTKRPARINNVKLTVTTQRRTERTRFGEASLFQVGNKLEDVTINVSYEYIFTDMENPEPATMRRTYTIKNAANVYIPYPVDTDPVYENNMWTFRIPINEEDDGIAEETEIVYADMRPSPASNTVDYYRIAFSDIGMGIAPFYVQNNSLNLEENNLRVVLHAYLNGGETGYIEMRPVRRDTDGTYLFETDMYPVNELVDVDNRINIASVDVDGGSWKPLTKGTAVSIDATNPKLRISVLFKAANNSNMASLINGDESFTGYYVNDEFDVDEFSLVQELKEMRSVVNFTETGTPTTEQFTAHKNLINWMEYNQKYYTFYQIKKMAEKQFVDQVPLTDEEYTYLNNISKDIKKYRFYENLEEVARVMKLDTEKDPYLIFYQAFDRLIKTLGNDSHFIELFSYNDEYVVRIYQDDAGDYYEDESFTIPVTPTEGVFYYLNMTQDCRRDRYLVYRYERGWNEVTDEIIMWEQVNNMLGNYSYYVDEELFNGYNLNSGMEIQLMPVVEASLMNSTQFTDFVHTFTQVHRAIEPVIFKRLEGNNYLDCKLIATYGKPHTYCSDKQYKLTTDEFWPDLDIQISFDVKLYNRALASNTISELKLIVQAYFNRLTTVHTPLDLLSMNNNIYVSHLIQQMEAHDNVAYMKFNGWYTNEKTKPNGNYMGPDVQAIVQRWRKLEDMPTEELERYVPEMFVLADRNIEINVLDDFTLA